MPSVEKQIKRKADVTGIISRVQNFKKTKKKKRSPMNDTCPDELKQAFYSHRGSEKVNLICTVWRYHY